MDQESIIRHVAETCPGVNVVTAGEEAPEIARGDTFFIYDPERNLPGKDQQPFATIVNKDYGEFDNASNLDRPGVFRLNIGLEKESFRALFGTEPEAGYDYAALDRLMPHPVYASHCWVCILNPSDATFEQQLRPLIAAAYERAAARHARRQSRH
jgi:hypothetical protein